MSARVFIWVQHLLGLGHFARARALAAALSDAGFAVTLASGGVTPSDAVPRDYAFVQLPPARAKDELFDELVDDTGALVDQRWHEARRDALLAAFDKVHPDIVITETFPFGRRLLNFELHALIETARARVQPPLIVASLRDILQRPRKPDRANAMVDYAHTNYDALLVHGDPGVVRLEESFAEIISLAERTHYTGYIGAKPQRVATRRTEILVSAGGGAAGKALIEAAFKARELSRLKGRPWTFVTGPLADGTAQHTPTNNVTIARTLPDFRARLSSAAVSVSQAGYNTLVEAVAAGTPTIAVPFETDREKEQRMRAEKFAARGWIKMMAQNALDPRALAVAIDDLADTTLPRASLNLDGAAGSVAALNTLLRRS
jgi:predicted glycosyltransferase